MIYDHVPRLAECDGIGQWTTRRISNGGPAQSVAAGRDAATQRG
ncbi:hypothetical protein [Bradyrhizobium sp.]|nr:hypothetical protein [Bradyrhizobium sp.]